MLAFIKQIKYLRRSIRSANVNPFVCFLILVPTLVLGQSVANLQRAGMGPLPESILSTRVFVFTDHTFTEKEINTVHAGLLKTGIDAVGYTQVDKLFAGVDITQAFVKYLHNREVGNLVFAFKNHAGYELMIIPLVVAESNTLTIPAAVWKTQHRSLDEALMTLYRTALAGRRKQNLLINEVPEIDLMIPVFNGNRNELFAYDLKVDYLAVQKFGNEKMDSELEEIMKSYPFKYKLVDVAIPEAELRKQGSSYLLRHIHTRGPAAKQLLGYDMSKGESALVSVTYPNGQEQIKTIAADVEVHKFYVRHIEFGHVFLGPRWDADTTWQQALKNFIKGLRNEMKLN